MALPNKLIESLFRGSSQTVIVRKLNEIIDYLTTLSGGTPPPTGEQSVIVASISTAASMVLDIGETQPITPSAYDYEGLLMTGVPFTYTSSDTNVATVNSSGAVTGVNEGGAEITIEGGSRKAILSITVGSTVGAVTSLTVSPQSFSLSSGQTQQLTPVALNSLGNPVSGIGFTYQTSNPAIATVSTSGLVTAISTGDVDISIHGAGLTIVANVTVTVGAVETLTLVPSSSVTLDPGGTYQINVLAQDAGGSAVNGVVFTYVSNNTSVATVTSGGLVTATGPGNTTVTVSGGGKSTTLDVGVSSVGIVSQITGVTPSLTDDIGFTTTLTGTAKDAAGGVVTTATVSWASSDTNVVTVTDNGTSAGVGSCNIELVGEGTATITASVGSITATCSVTSNTPPELQTVVEAAFVGAADTNLTAYTPEVGDAFVKAPTYTGDLVLDGNGYVDRASSAPFDAVYINEAVPVTADYRVRAAMRPRQSANGMINIGAAIRVSNTEQTGYFAWFDTINQVVLFKLVNGSATQIGNTSYTIATGEEHHLEMRAEGDQIVVATKNVTASETTFTDRITVTDTDIPAAGHGGVFASSGATQAAPSDVQLASLEVAPLGAPGGGEEEPPPGGGELTSITASAFRLNGADGSGVGEIMIPVPPGVMTSPTDLDNVVVKLSSVEQAVELEIRGQHPDGSYSVVGGAVSIANITAASPIAAEVILHGTPTVARTTVGGRWSYAPNRTDPRFSGYPDVVIVPTDPAYLTTTQLCGPYNLRPASEVKALGGQYQRYLHHFEDHSGWWWSTNAGSGPNGTAPSTSNPHSWEATNSNNPSFPGYGDLTSPDSDYQAWRIASAYVGGSAYPMNGYDNGNAHLQYWLMTGDTTYLTRGMSYIANYTHEYIKKAGIDVAGLSGMNGYQIFADGVAAYHLLTGDPTAKLAIQWWADRLRVLTAYFDEPGGFGYSASSSDPDGAMSGFDGRESGRFLQCMLAGHRCRLTQSWFSGDGYHDFDYAAYATTIATRMLLTGADNHARKADGTWREQRCTDSAGFYINTFMQPILMNELIKYYHQIDPNATILAAVQQCWETLYGTLWGIWDYTYNGIDWFTADVKSFRNNYEGGCASLEIPHPNNGDGSGLTPMYLASGAWLVSKTGSSTHLAQITDVLNNAVGTDVQAGDAGAFGEPFGYGRKLFGEHYYNAMQAFGYLEEAE